MTEKTLDEVALNPVTSVPFDVEFAEVDDIQWYRRDAMMEKTLDEVALNPDGKTYNGAKTLKWMFEALNPGMTITEAEIEAMWKNAQERHGK
jgi:hypothetical protein